MNKAKTKSVKSSSTHKVLTSPTKPSLYTPLHKAIAEYNKGSKKSLELAGEAIRIGVEIESSAGTKKEAKIRLKEVNLIFAKYSTLSNASHRKKILRWYLYLKSHNLDYSGISFSTILNIIHPVLKDYPDKTECLRVMKKFYKYPTPYQWKNEYLTDTSKKKNPVNLVTDYLDGKNKVLGTSGQKTVLLTLIDNIRTLSLAQTVLTALQEHIKGLKPLPPSKRKTSAKYKKNSKIKTVGGETLAIPEPLTPSLPVVAKS